MDEPITFVSAALATIGALVASVRWLSGKVIGAHDARIAALEKAVDRSDARHAACEADRTKLHETMLKLARGEAI